MKNEVATLVWLQNSGKDKNIAVGVDIIPDRHARVAKERGEG